MTICIASICDFKANPKIIFCSDRLVTDSKGLTFEQGKPKIMELTTNCYVMMAGRSAESDKILTSTLDIIQEKYKEELYPKIKDIVRIVKNEHQKLREECINDEILKPRGLTLEKFYQNIKNFPDWLGIMLDNQISNYEFDVNFLIFGLDIRDDTVSPKLYLINNEGEDKLVNTLGFGIIGIGDTMSLPELTRDTYNPDISLSEALVRVFWAKKSAERVISVGRETTDLGIMEAFKDEKGEILISVFSIDKEIQKSLLQKNYDEYIKKIKSTTEQIRQNIDKIVNPDTKKSIS